MVHKVDRFTLDARFKFGSFTKLNVEVDKIIVALNKTASMINTAQKITLKHKLPTYYTTVVPLRYSEYSAILFCLYSDQYITATKYCNLIARIGGAIAVIMLINVPGIYKINNFFPSII